MYLGTRLIRFVDVRLNLGKRVILGCEGCAATVSGKGIRGDAGCQRAEKLPCYPEREEVIWARHRRKQNALTREPRREAAGGKKGRPVRLKKRLRTALRCRINPLLDAVGVGSDEPIRYDLATVTAACESRDWQPWSRDLRYRNWSAEGNTQLPRLTVRGENLTERYSISLKTVRLL